MTWTTVPGLTVRAANATTSGAGLVAGFAFGVAAAFGGLLPAKWGMVIENKSGVALDSSGHTTQYRGAHAQVL